MKIMKHVNSSYKRFNEFNKTFKRLKNQCKKSSFMLIEEEKNDESSFQSSAQGLLSVMSRYKLQGLKNKGKIGLDGG
jgi:hypothetical protein